MIRRHALPPAARVAFGHDEAESERAIHAHAQIADDQLAVGLIGAQPAVGEPLQTLIKRVAGKRCRQRLALWQADMFRRHSVKIAAHRLDIIAAVGLGEDAIDEIVQRQRRCHDARYRHAFRHKRRPHPFGVIMTAENAKSEIKTAPEKSRTEATPSIAADAVPGSMREREQHRHGIKRVDDEHA